MTPPVAFRETICRAAIGERKYIRYFDNRGHFAHLKVQLSPADRINVSATDAARQAIPESCCRAALNSLRDCMQCGPVRGFPLHNIDAQIIGGTYLERHSYPQAFAHAAQMAFDDALRHAIPVVAEPWIELKIFLRDATLSDLVHAIQQLGEDLELSFRSVDPSTVRTSLPVRLLPELEMCFAADELIVVPVANRPLDYRPVGADFRWDKPDRANFASWT